MIELKVKLSLSDPEFKDRWLEAEQISAIYKYDNNNTVIVCGGIIYYSNKSENFLLSATGSGRNYLR